MKFLFLSIFVLIIPICFTIKDKTSNKENAVKFVKEESVLVEADVKGEEEIVNKIPLKKINIINKNDKLDKKALEKSEIAVKIQTHAEKNLPHYLKSQQLRKGKGIILSDPNSSSSSPSTNTPSVDPFIYRGNCFIKMHNLLYNLNPMTTDAKGLTKIYSIKDQNGDDIDFSICRNVVERNCTNDKPSLITQKKGGDCNALSDSFKQDKVWSVSRNTAKNFTSLILTLPPGGDCGAGKPYTTKFVINCDHKLNGVIVHKNQIFNTKQCENTINMSSIHACPINRFYSWWNYMPFNKWLTGIVLFGLGVYFAIFGQKHFTYSSGFIIGGTAGFILHGIFQPVIPGISFIYYVVIGILIGILVFLFNKIIGIAVGIVAGYLIGNLLFNAIVPIIPIDPIILFYICIVFCSIPIMIFAYQLQKHLVILVTSFIGCYISVRGIAHIIGSFPDESFVAKLAEHFEFNQITRLYSGDSFMYIIAIFVMFVVSVYTQYLINPEEKCDNSKLLEESNL